MPAEPTPEEIEQCRPEDIVYETYKCEEELAELTALVDKELSEPYSVFTYRFFVNYWPKLTIIARFKGVAVGVIMAKIEPDIKNRRRGYIGMLVVDPRYRGKRIGTNLARLEIVSMQQQGADLIVLETECTNHTALKLYEQLGFVRSKQLNAYYMNGASAYRLKFWCRHYPGLGADGDYVEEDEARTAAEAAATLTASAAAAATAATVTDTHMAQDATAVAAEPEAAK